MALNKGIPVLGLLSVFAGVGAHAGTMGPVQAAAPGQLYVGVFGGGGAADHVNMSQYGTAYYLEAEGGPLAVDAFGRSNSPGVGMVGAHLGYQWGEFSLNTLAISPAVELEGYYIGKRTFEGHEFRNDTTRLPEHDFFNRYPLSTGVFLINSVINLNSANYSQWHPYVGAGIGGAVLSITNADSLQVAPLEAGLNHYNANPHDKTSAFAGQVKVGLRYAFSEHTSIFAEYRWLYLASTDFTFGSTVAPGHPVTSSWLVNMGSQQYNLGAAGIRFSI